MRAIQGQAPRPSHPIANSRCRRSNNFSIHSSIFPPQTMPALPVRRAVLRYFSSLQLSTPCSIQSLRAPAWTSYDEASCQAHRRLASTSTTFTNRRTVRPIRDSSSQSTSIRYTTTTTTSAKPAKPITAPVAKISPSLNKPTDGSSPPSTSPLPEAPSSLSTDTLSPTINKRALRDGLSDEPLESSQNDHQVDWSRSFHGLSNIPFSNEASAILMQPIAPEDIEIKPDGIVYLPEIKYRRILNRAFGPGGWGLAPRGETIVTSKSVTREYGLVVHGR